MAKRRSADAYRRVERVEVFLWGRYVGAVALDPTLGFYVFAYDRDFARSGVEPAPLSMPSRIMLGQASIWFAFLSAVISVAATAALIPVATRLIGPAIRLVTGKAAAH